MQYPPNQAPNQQPQQSPEYSQYPQQQPEPKKKRGKLPLILGIIAAVLVLSCIGVSVLISSTMKNANTGTAVGTVSTSGTSSTSSNTPAPTTQHFAVGQVVKVGETWEVTINSAKTNTGSEFNKPQHAGNVFLVFSITLKNISSQEQNVSSALNFTLTDTSGQKYDETIDTDAGSTLDGKVEAGSPLKGAV